MSRKAQKPKRRRHVEKYLRTMEYLSKQNRMARDAFRDGYNSRFNKGINYKNGDGNISADITNKTKTWLKENGIV